MDPLSPEERTDARFAQAANALLDISRGDPTQETPPNGEPQPRELLQTQNLVIWLCRLEPNASTALRLAGYAQHVGRYRTPRSSYPAGRVGYLKWRTDQAKRHAETAASILTQAGYDEAVIQRVRRIVTKSQRTQDAEVQTMEDALCLAFLEHEYPTFSALHSDEKVIHILQKTWGKMSDRAHTLATQLPFAGRPQRLLTKALTG